MTNRDATVTRIAQKLHQQQCSSDRPWDDLRDFHQTWHLDDAAEVLSVALDEEQTT